jgi:hypothetical protein
LRGLAAKSFTEVHVKRHIRGDKIIKEHHTPLAVG